MMQFPYSRSERPPVPVVPVNIANPDNQTSESATGKVDTGAARTMIPLGMARRLGLPAAGIRRVRAFDGHTIELATFTIDLSAAGLTLEEIEVGAVERSNVLLGRDVLNMFDLTLRGKQFMSELTLAG